MAKRFAKCPECGNRVEVDSETGGKIVCLECKATLTVNIRKTGEPDHTKKPAEPVDPLIGKSLREFEIMGLLGRGGMGAVYRAKDAKLDRQVAVKVLAPRYARDPKFVLRFEREARAAAAVNHSNIIQIYSVGEDGGHHFIAMELVEGLTLADVLRADGAMPVKRAMGVMKQLASALAEAHGKGVIHRDVKPSNIILAAGDQAKVTDFGIAKRPEVDANVTQAGRLMGTVTYLPPETARGKPFDARSDLYSLGITFYEMLSGRPPFQGGTTAQLIAHHLETEPPELSESAPDVPSSLCRLVHRLLSKDPAGRHQSATELLTALKGLSGASRIAPRRPSGKVPTAKKSERPKLLIPGVIAAAVLAIGIGFVLIFVLGGDDPGPKDGEPPSVAKPVVVKPPPPPPEKPPAWQAAWQAAKTKADGLAKDEKFGEALAVYETLAAEDDDTQLNEKIQQSASALHEQAAAAWRRVRDQAQSLSDRKKFAEATAALRPALEIFGLAEHTQQARTMLAKIAAAQAAAKPTTRPVVIKPPPPPPATRPVVVKPTPKTQPAPATQPKPSPGDDLRRKREARYAQALRPVEALVATWDFRAAEAALAKLEFKELAERLATRRDELQRLAKLKAKMIEQVNKTKPWLRKGQAVVPGSGGKKFRTTGEQITSADEKGVTVREIRAVGEKSRRQSWAELDKRVLPKLLALAVAADDADDQLAAGLLALVRKDAATAEKHFEKARTLGAKIDRYLTPLAAAALAKAKAQMDGKKYAEAAAALTALDKKYGKTPWFASHKDEVAAARTRARSAIADAEAEKLYTQAAKCFKEKDLWDLKPLVEKLKTDYPKVAPVTDAKRKPSFAELAKAVEKLGKFLTVRKDGKGDFKSIQAAIDAATPYSLIEIQDSATYAEMVAIGNKPGITVRGGRGSWPILAPRGKPCVYPHPGSPGISLQRLVLSGTAGSHGTETLFVPHGGEKAIRVRSSIIATNRRNAVSIIRKTTGTEFDNCVIVGNLKTEGPIDIRNTVFLKGGLNSRDEPARLQNVVAPAVVAHGRCELRSCTILDSLMIEGVGDLIQDCIVYRITCAKPNAVISSCDVFGKPPFAKAAKPGKGCFTKDPQFRDPENFDYRLKPTSPCRGKASDGGDVGARYTPEMIEILKKAFELRKKGIIKF